ncbi:MAG: MBL fold metallo-hydrolase [Oscillospiraceae bacterium]|nr:MBL fold metallo-hydrolase [Oscillospiraceae bacterium]
MKRLCTLYSGSSGNATYIGNEEEGILIDIGKNAKQTISSLLQIGVSPDKIKAVFITHEHIDHVAGLRVFCNKFKVPVFATNGTLSKLDIGGHLKGDFDVFCMTDYADVSDMHIELFHTLHDASESCGYTVSFSDGRKASVATDLGVMTESVLDALLGSTALVLESNHDIKMLENGPYPYPLKRRILSEYGHLSNDMCGESAVKLVESGAKHLLLGHLSAENNIPELAYQTTKGALAMAGAELNGDYHLEVASRHAPVCVSF